MHPEDASGIGPPRLFSNFQFLISISSSPRPVIPTEAGRRFFLTARSREAVGLRREDLQPIARLLVVGRLARYHLYEVAVPQRGDSWVGGYNISDWAEDVLQLSSNERLRSSTLKGSTCL